MTRLGFLFICATLSVSVLLASCGSSGNEGTGGAGGGSGGAGVGTGGAGVGTGGAGGGGGTIVNKPIEDIVPGDNTVTGWTRDPEFTDTINIVAALAYDFTKAEQYIDGSADPFYTDAFAPKVLAWQNYLNSSTVSANNPNGYKMKLYILEMPSAAQATAIYDSLGSGDKPYYANNTWTDISPAIGDKARITNSLTDWWINFRKGVYYVEARLTYAEKEDLVGKEHAIKFATDVAAKM